MKDDNIINHIIRDHTIKDYTIRSSVSQYCGTFYRTTKSGTANRSASTKKLQYQNQQIHLPGFRLGIFKTKSPIAFRRHIRIHQGRIEDFNLYHFSAYMQLSQEFLRKNPRFRTEGVYEYVEGGSRILTKNYSLRISKFICWFSDQEFLRQFFRFRCEGVYEYVERGSEKIAKNYRIKISKRLEPSWHRQPL